LADVVESLIGAVYLHGGFDYALMCARFFDLGIKWEPLPSRIEAMLSRVETYSDLPSQQLESVERMLGYTFTHKLLLVEALTHASYQQDLRTISYERLEFCGDAVLDMIVTEFLYRAEGKEYSPGHMFHRKSAMVNAHILAFFCLGMHIDVPLPMPRPAGNERGPRGTRRIEVQTDLQTIHLWQCLLHSNPRILDEQKAAFERFEARRAEIDAAFASGAIFPWAALVRLQAPKFLSDMVESVLGAVFLDARGDLDAVRRVLRRLGLLPVLERVVWADVDVLHPVSRLSMWASKRAKKLQFVYIEEAREISCAVALDGEVVEESRVTDEYRGKLTKEEVRLAAAEKAILLFRLRDVNANYATLKRKASTKSKKRKRSNSTGSALGTAAPST
jgi:dsRNA-specific ribonuclease